MKKLSLLLSICLLFLLVGCKGETPTTQTKQIEFLQKVEYETYCNLVDKDLQSKLSTVFTSSGVTEQRQNVFFDHVNQFNQSVNSDLLVNDFTKIDLETNQYDPYDMMDQWNAKHPEFIGYNCRITAFSLFSDYIKVDEKAEVRDDILFMDDYALESDDTGLCGDSIDKFKAFYSTIPTVMSKDENEHVNVVLNDWKQRGISFEKNDKMSLVTVFFHEVEDDSTYLFIGHVGVLIELQDGLCFIEKIAFQEPYQISKFKDRTQLNDYLMAKYDVNFDQPTASPFIMENDKLMQGYRKNPNNTQ